MTPRQLLELLFLAAVWGGSFLFMRVAAPEFGPAPLMWLRVAIAALSLLPLWWWWRRRAPGSAGPPAPHHPWRDAALVALVGLLNAALPFVLLAWALLYISAGLGAILNATAPMWAALIATLWLREPLPWLRALGLGIGLAGVILLAGDRAGISPDAPWTWLGLGWGPILAGLTATLCYGLSANLTRRHLGHIPPLHLALGSMLAATVWLSPFALLYWPEQSVSALAWLCAVAIGVLSTGVAFVVFFRLIAEVGPTRAVSVTFLVPAFGMLWGLLFLQEHPGLQTLAGGVVVLIGTALALGLLPRGQSSSR